jgi:hypothetical protein
MRTLRDLIETHIMIFKLHPNQTLHLEGHLDDLSFDLYLNTEDYSEADPQILALFHNIWNGKAMMISNNTGPHRL